MTFAPGCTCTRTYPPPDEAPADIAAGCPVHDPDGRVSIPPPGPDRIVARGWPLGRVK